MKRRKGSIEEFDAAARAHDMRYADLQKKETAGNIQKIRRIPEGYKKVSEWRKEKNAE